MSPINILEKLFEEFIQKSFSFEKIVAKAVQNNLAIRGIRITKSQLAKIEKTIYRAKIKQSSIPDSSADANKLIFKLDGISDENVSIELDLEEDIKKTCDKILEDLENEVPTIGLNIAVKILEALKRSFPTHQKRHKKVIKLFNQNMSKVWGTPINIVEGLDISLLWIQHSTRYEKLIIQCWIVLETTLKTHMDGPQKNYLKKTLKLQILRLMSV